MDDPIRRWELTLEDEDGNEVMLEKEFVGTSTEAHARADLLAQKYDADFLSIIHLNSLGRVRDGK